MVNKHFIAGLLCAAAGLSLGAEPPPPPSQTTIPDEIILKHDTYFESLWVAADLVFDDAGKADISRFDVSAKQFFSGTYEAYRRQLAKPTAPPVLPFRETDELCTLLTVRPGGPGLGPFSVEGRAAKAKVALAGRVVETRMGFHRGFLVTLLAIEVVHYAKVPAQFQSVRRVLVPYKSGRLKVGNGWLCVANEVSPLRPVPNSEIVVFARGWVEESPEVFLLADGQDVLFPDADGALVLSPVFSQWFGSTWAGLFEAVRTVPTDIEGSP